MKKLLRKRESEAKDIDISPLIDVVFLLLIFFMVSSTFAKDMQIDLERPGAQSAGKSDARSLRIFIDSAGQIYVDELPVRAWMVQSRVRDLLHQAPSSNVLVVTDRRVPAETLIDVVDQCRLAGASDVGVATESEAGG